MSRLPDEFHQDRALRDAARAVLFAEIEHVKGSLSGKGLAGRVTGRVGDGAKDVLEVAKVHAQDRQGLLAGLIALIALWLAREPLKKIFGFGSQEELDEEATLDDNSAEAEHDAAPPSGGVETEPSNTHVEPEADRREPLTTGETA